MTDDKERKGSCCCGGSNLEELPESSDIDSAADTGCCRNSEEGSQRELSGLNDKAALMRRLKRIEGQIKGIQNMVEEQRYCVDILVQISAVKSAINKVGSIILENHVKGCVKNELENSAGDSEEIIEELMGIISRFYR